MRTCLFILLMAVPMPSLAQELPDSGLPDASVEGGSAEGMTEENDPKGGPCLNSKDCSQGFACTAQRCVPVKPRNAGCSSVPVVVLAAGALALGLRRRRA